MRSIKWKLTVSYVSLSLLIIGIVGTLSLYFIRIYTKRQEKEFLYKTAESLAKEVHTYFQAKHTSNIQLKQLADTIAILNDVQVRIIGQKQNIMVESDYFYYQGYFFHKYIDNLRSETFKDFPIFNAKIFNGERKKIQTVTNNNVKKVKEPDKSKTPVNKVKVPIGSKNNPLGYIELSMDFTYSKNIIDTALNAFLIAALGAVLIAVTLGLMMGRRISAPIIKLSSVVNSMGQSDWSIRAKVNKPDEIGRLAHHFNSMADRLQTSYNAMTKERDTLKRFIQDASHELRTPITALKTFNELLQTRTGNQPEARREFLYESQIQLEKLSWIIQNLLDLSRLDAGMSSLHLTENILDKIISNAWHVVSKKAENKNMQLTRYMPPEPISIKCDKHRMEMLLTNLFDNAITYSRHDTVVNIKVVSNEKMLEIMVRDQGIGIPENEVPYIFNRFYRVNNNQEPGTGLGLAIVKSIVEAHQGNIQVISSEEKGTEFHIKIPTLV